MVTFADASLNDATSWEWSFEGGVPSTSTAANPSVFFTTPGEHLVTLSTSNGNGTGTTWSSPITIDICTGTGDPATTDYALAPTLTSDLVILRAPGGTNGEFTVFDGQGRTVATGRLEPQVELDVRSWSPGIYTVHAAHGMIGRFCVTR
jgi:hypothetical protein